MSTRATRIGLAVIKAAMETSQPPASVQRLLRDRLQRGGGLGPLFAALNQKMKFKSQKYRQMLAQPLLPPPKPTGQARPKKPLGKAGAIGQEIIKRAVSKTTQDYVNRMRAIRAEAAGRQPIVLQGAARAGRPTRSITIDPTNAAATRAYLGTGANPSDDIVGAYNATSGDRGDRYRAARAAQKETLLRHREPDSILFRGKKIPRDIMVRGQKILRNIGDPNWLPTYRGMRVNPNRLRGLSTASVGREGEGDVFAGRRSGTAWDPNKTGLSHEEYAITHPASDPYLYQAYMQRWRDLEAKHWSDLEANNNRMPVSNRQARDAIKPSTQPAPQYGPRAFPPTNPQPVVGRHTGAPDKTPFSFRLR